MGDIGPERQRFEVLPVREPAAARNPDRREPAVVSGPRQPARPADRSPQRG